MLKLISEKITDQWIMNGVINKEFKEAYIYGVLLLLSTGINVAIIIIISAFIHNVLIWIPFLAGFIPLRVTAGGFHAKTPLKCGVFFCSGYTIFLALMTYIPNSAKIIIEFINIVISAILVFRLAPIPASNKPLSSNELFRKRELSIIIIAISLFLVVLFSLSRVTSGPVLMWSFGVLGASLSLVIGKTASLLSH